MDDPGNVTGIWESPGAAATDADVEPGRESLRGMKIGDNQSQNEGLPTGKTTNTGAGRPAKKSWAKITNGKSFGTSVAQGKQTASISDHKSKKGGKRGHLTGTEESADDPESSQLNGSDINQDDKLTNYNPKNFPFNQKGGRYFVIKSYCEEDIQYSIEANVWCSSKDGNKKLQEAFLERQGNSGTVYLFFSVNGSGHFCGMAQMSGEVNFKKRNRNWSQIRWKGKFKVEWIYVKDVPNSQLRHIRLENNENKSVTNSRDTQEVPPVQGRQVLKIINSYRHTTSIFDDEEHLKERRAKNREKIEEEASRSTSEIVKDEDTESSEEDSDN